MGSGFGLFESAPARCVDIDGAGMQMLSGGALLFVFALSVGRPAAVESRKCVMDFDWRVLLSARVWFARWFHCLQLAAEQRHTRDVRRLMHT